MHIWHIILAVAALGAIGGFLPSALAGEIAPPHIDKSTRVWRPEWLGNVFIGGVASVVIWGIYGPLATYDLATSQYQDIHLTVSQLVSSIVVGMGGGKILTQMVQFQAERVSRNKYVDLFRETLGPAPPNREEMDHE